MDRLHGPRVMAEINNGPNFLRPGEIGRLGTSQDEYKGTPGLNVFTGMDDLTRFGDFADDVSFGAFAILFAIGPLPGKISRATHDLHNTFTASSLQVELELQTSDILLFMRFMSAVLIPYLS